MSDCDSVHDLRVVKEALTRRCHAADILATTSTGVYALYPNNPPTLTP
jgi:hypothetical protein